MAGITKHALLSELRTWASEQPDLLALYLFGSEVTGRTLPWSDLDVAALARFDIPRPQLWRLEDRWAARWDRFEGSRVDFVVLNLAPLPFRFEVITTGEVIWAAGGAAVADFESITRRRYWDVQPLLDRDWRAFVRRLEEGRNEAERRQYQTALEQVRRVHRRVKEASDPDLG
jgi:uncharacterized protein